jgi:uncharacterized protein YigA (DUF484 family)
MTSPTAEQVAQYLQDHPGFFDAHAELLASITVPHPHGARQEAMVRQAALYASEVLPHFR